MLAQASGLSRSDPERTLQLAKQCHAAALDLGYTRGIALALRHHGHSLAVLGHFDKAIPLMQRARAAAKRASEDELEVECLRFLTHCRFEVGDYEGAAGHCIAMATLADQREGEKDVAELKAWVLETAALWFARSQQYERSLVLFEAALSLVEPIGSRQLGTLRGYVGSCQQHLGMEAEARRNLTLALKHLRGRNGLHESHCLVQLARNEARAGNTTGAQALLAQAEEAAERFGSDYAMAVCRCVGGHVYLHVGNLGKARECFESALPAGPGVLNDYYRFLCHDGMAKVLDAERQWEEAYVHLRAAQTLQAKLLRAAESPALEAAYRHIAGALIRSPPPAVGARAQAPTTSSTLLKVRDSATQARERRESAPADDAAAALSPRQRAVLELVAAGCSNIEIGRRLGISTHTVRFHLAVVFSKLGAKRRSEAVALFASLDTADSAASI